MRYIMQKQLFAWGDTFTIKNEQEQDMYMVKGAVFSLGKHLTFLDMAGNELLTIQQRLLTLTPCYDIFRGATQYASVSRDFFLANLVSGADWPTIFSSLTGNAFTINLPDAPALHTGGDFFGHEYSFMQNGQVVAQVSMQWFSWANTYGVDIAAGADTTLILACTVVLDEVSHEGQR